MSWNGSMSVEWKYVSRMEVCLGYRSMSEAWKYVCSMEVYMKYVGVFAVRKYVLCGSMSEA